MRSSSISTSLVFFSLFFSSLASDDDIVGGYVGFNDVSRMPFPRSDMTATLFEANEISPTQKHPRIYLFGGCVSDQICTTDSDGTRSCFCTSTTARCNYYMPDIDKWSSNCTSAPVERYRHGWAKVNGKVYLTGGRNLVDDIIKSIDIYDPKTNAWEDPIFWPNATSDMVAWGYGNIVFIVGGYLQDYSDSTTLWGYDTVAKKWLSKLPAMVYPRGDTQVQEYLGKQYVAGGWDKFGKLATGGCAQPVKFVEVFNSATRTWQTYPNLMYGRGDMALGIIKGIIFGIGGEAYYSNDTTCSNSVAVPTVGSSNLGQSTAWNQVDSIPSGRFRFVGTSWNNSKTGLNAIYLFGGQTSFLSSCDCYKILNYTTLYVPKITVTHHSHPQTLNAGAIAGIVIGAVVAAVLFVIGCISCISYYSYTRYFKLQEDHTSPAAPAAVSAIDGEGSDVKQQIELSRI